METTRLHISLELINSALEHLKTATPPDGCESALGVEQLSSDGQYLVTCYINSNEIEITVRPPRGSYQAVADLGSYKAIAGQAV